MRKVRNRRQLRERIYPTTTQQSSIFQLHGRVVSSPRWLLIGTARQNEIPSERKHFSIKYRCHAQENPRINRQDRQKITFPGSAYPKEIPQQCTPATHTQKQCIARGSSWGGVGLPSLSLTTKGSWIHRGGGSPNLSSAL